MNGRRADRRDCLNRIATLVLLVGLASAVFLYWTAEKNTHAILGYDTGGGEVYPILPGDSKKYLRDLEIYGGKSAVLVEEFKSWFVGLWHGKSLAWIVAGATLFVSGGLFYVARRKPPCEAPDRCDKTSGES